MLSTVRWTDANFKARALPAPKLSADSYADKPAARTDDWSVSAETDAVRPPVRANTQLDEDEGGLRRQPELDMTVPQAPPVEEEPSRDVGSLLDDDDDGDAEVERMRTARVAPQQGSQRLARNAALDPDDGIAL